MSASQIFAVEPGYLLGNINDKHMLELIVSPKQRQFGQDKRDTLTRYCLDCDVRFACNGGCPKDRFATSPYGEPGQDYLCPGYKAFFHHVTKPMDTMATLLRASRAPAELMAVYAAQDSRRGRNDPCPCGSSRKWKRCHGAAPTRPQPSETADVQGCPVPDPRRYPKGSLWIFPPTGAILASFALTRAPIPAARPAYGAAPSVKTTPEKRRPS